MAQEKLVYKRPSKCIGGIGCVEVKIASDHARIRQSGNRRAVVHLSKEEWDNFVEAIKAGEFDEKTK